MSDLQTMTLAALHGSLSPVADGVGRLGVVFVNVYAIETTTGYVLVDTGLPAAGWYVRRAMAELVDQHGKPEAIVLTHGHFDHAGNAAELADAWGVKVYAHPLELPYLTGKSDYPPQDPTPGGAMCFLSRFFPHHGIDLGHRVEALPADGSVPHLPGWRWIHTPGHTAGHVSLVRESDHTVIAGDALATTDLDAWSSQFTWPQTISRPPTPFTPDWEASRASIRRLADEQPRTIAAGHGLPIHGDQLAAQLQAFAEQMTEPEGGRYTGHPAEYATDGSVAQLPPSPADPLPKMLLGGMAAGIALGFLSQALAPRERRG